MADPWPEALFSGPQLTGGRYLSV